MTPGSVYSVYTGGRADDFADFCRRARAGGWDAVEFAEGPEATGEALCRQAAAEAAEAGISIRGLLLISSGRDFELTSDAPERLQLALRQAAWLGAGAVRIFPGAQRPGPAGSFRLYETVLNRSFELLDSLLPASEELGVRIELRVPAPGFLLSPAEARDFLDRLNSPAVAAQLELDALSSIGGLPADWILSLGPRLASVRTSPMLPDAYSNLRGLLARAAFAGAIISLA